MDELDPWCAQLSVPESTSDVEWRLGVEDDSPIPELETIGVLDSAGSSVDTGVCKPALLVGGGVFWDSTEELLGLSADAGSMSGDGTLSSCRGLTTVPSDRSITGTGSWE